MDTFKDAKNQLFIALCLNVGNIMIGYSVGWLSPVLPKLQDKDQTPLPYVLDIENGSWIGSSYNIGLILGPYLAGNVANVLGRKRCILLAGLITTIGHVFLMSARNLPMILGGRMITGFGGGMICVTNMIYIGEMASTNIRGVILSSTGVFHCFGSLLVYCVGPYVSYSAVGCLLLSISVLHLIGCMYIPESPIYHLIKGREDETIAVLNYLGRSKDTEELKTLLRLTKLSQEEQEWNLSEIFTIKSNRKSFFIVTLVFILQQCCGMLAALYFTTNIFKSAGSSIEPALATIITGVTQLAGTIIVPGIIEKAGRKTLLLVSTTGCCFSMTVLGAYFYLHRINHPALENLGWLPLATLMIAFFSFSIGLNIIPNALIGELFRSNVRSVGSSLAFTMGCLTGFASLTSFGYIIKAFSYDILFWMFAGVNAIGFVFILIVVPETKGLSLAEIQMKLERGRG